MVVLIVLCIGVFHAIMETDHQISHLGRTVQQGDVLYSILYSINVNDFEANIFRSRR